MSRIKSACVVAIIAVVGLPCLSGCSGRSESSPVATPDTSTAAVTEFDGSGLEAQGYTALDGGKFYAKKIDKDAADFPGCSYSSMNCLILAAAASIACGSLSAEAQVTDSQGRLSDTVYATSGAVEAGQVALLEFDYKSVKGGRISPTHIYCMP